MYLAFQIIFNFPLKKMQTLFLVFLNLPNFTLCLSSRIISFEILGRRICFFFFFYQSKTTLKLPLFTKQYVFRKLQFY